MNRSRRRVVCSCGAILPTPLPMMCPSCGAYIVGVRRGLGRQVVSLLIVVALALSCLAYGWWLLS